MYNWWDNWGGGVIKKQNNGIDLKKQERSIDNSGQTKSKWKDIVKPKYIINSIKYK